MGTCLITTLKETVSDSSLLKLGDFCFHISGNSVTSIRISSASPITMTTKPPGYFTDSNGSSNLGTTMTVTSSTSWLYLSAGEYDVVVSDKYQVGTFDCTKNNNVESSVKMNLADLAGMKRVYTFTVSAKSVEGDIAYLDETNAGIVRIEANSDEHSNITGSISSLQTINPVYLSLTGCKNVTGNINVFANNSVIEWLDLTNDTNIGGSLSSIGNCSTLQHLGVEGTNITGTLNDISNLSQLQVLSIVNNRNITGYISALAGLKNLRGIYASNSGITGDTSSLAGLTNLTTFTYANTAVTGNWPLT